MKVIYSTEANCYAKFILIEGLNGSGKTTQAKKLTENLKQNGIPAVFNHEPSAGIFGRIIRQLVDHAQVDSRLLKEAKEAVAQCLEVTNGNPRSQRQFLGLLLNVLNALGMARKLSEWEKQIIFIANRIEDIRDNILPNLRKGLWVVQDRYDISCYSHGMSNDVDFTKLLELHQRALNNSYLAPDVIFYYWLPIPVALERLRVSGKIIDFYENKENLERIEKASREILMFTDENPEPHQALVKEFKMGQNTHKVIIINAEPSIEDIGKETWQYVRNTFGI
jgi:dTMP kinase